MGTPILVDLVQTSSGRVLRGSSLVHAKVSNMQCAALCAQALLGELWYQPTTRQAIEAFGAPTAYVMAIMKLPPHARAAIASGEDRISYLGLKHLLRGLQGLELSN
jgi:hypothetical protein